MTAFLSKAKRTVGLTLIELMVTIAIMSLIVVGAFQVFSEGLQLFKTNQAAAEAQASVIKILGRITTEMVNSNKELTKIFSAPGNVDGVVFASPLDDTGKAQFHDVNGKVYWQKYISYYYIPNTQYPSQGKLYRSEIKIADEPGIELGKSGSTSLPNVKAGFTSHTTDFFAYGSDPGIQTRLLGDTISGFRLKVFDGTVEEESGTSRDILGGNDSNIDRSVAIDVTLESGNKDNTSSTGYYIRVDSRVAPRG